jgi:predicted dinucleotide-utilizing enzyme
MAAEADHTLTAGNVSMVEPAVGAVSGLDALAAARGQILFSVFRLRLRPRQWALGIVPSCRPRRNLLAGWLRVTVLE